MTRITLPPSVVHALCDPMPDGKDFTPTRFTPASTKAWFARHMVHFLASDCPRHQFTQRFHNQLVHCFSLTPHYGLRGFWTEHFATARGKAAFIGQVLRHSGSGTPNQAWRDVEREISRRVRQSGLLDLYRQHSADEQDAADRAELARLVVKHGQCNAAVEPGILRTVLMPISQAAPARVPKRHAKNEQRASSLQPRLGHLARPAWPGAGRCAGLFGTRMGKTVHAVDRTRAVRRPAPRRPLPP